jgi:hypothetical protein
MSSRLIWRVAITVTSTVAAAAARKGLARSWKALRGGPPPRNPAAPEVRWREAALWAIGSASVAAGARLMARVAVTEVERRST